jgi:hypothetical protein
VQRVGGPPCQRRYSGLIYFEASNGISVIVRSKGDGSFRILLEPGTYTVSSGNQGFPIVKPFDVTVKPHAFTTIEVMFDSGIR